MNDIPRYDRSLLMGEEIHIKTGSEFNEVELHWHDYYELIVYFDADVKCTINGNSIGMSGCSAYLLTPFDFHKTVNVRSDNSISFLNISFTASALDKNIIAKIKNSRIIKSLPENDIIISLTKLIAELKKNSKENSVHLTSVLVNLICEKGEIVQGIESSHKGEFIKNVYEYVAKNFSSQISLEDVATHLHLAPAYFSARFSREAGYTFVKYLTLFRLNFSKELLIHTDKTVTQVCFESGFSSLSHFLRTFKAYFGATPLNYRKHRK